MSQSRIKKIMLATIAAITLAVQLPLPALAATDATALASAQSGINYLAANQNSDGSINGSFGGTTDWAAIAIQADGKQASALSNGGVSALDFMKTDVPGPATTATDVERKVIAIAATGQDTKAFGGVDYDAALAGYHASQQIGDQTLLNDDIFGVIAAGAANDPSLHDTAQDGLDYLLAHQGADGGFSYTTASCAFCGSDSNDTAAAIIAMQAAEFMGLSNSNLIGDEAKAVTYLLSTQQADGGFAYDVFSPSDGSSTSWSLMALNSVGDAGDTNALAARDWLLANQNPDGGFSYGAFGITASDTSTTAHAIIALLGTTWLLQPSPIHGPVAAPPATGGSGGSSTGNTAVSSTPPANTTTTTTSPDNSPPATSDPQVLGAQTGTQGTDKPASPAKTKPKQNNSILYKANTSYSLYAVLALGFIAFIWYMLQSRRKPEGA